MTEIRNEKDPLGVIILLPVKTRLFSDMQYVCVCVCVCARTRMLENSLSYTNTQCDILV